MKKLLTLLAAIAMLFVACSKDDEGGNSLNPLPPMTDPEDVCTAMECIEFMRYCYKNFDVNLDGKVSPAEALGVKEMHIDVFPAHLTSLAGIEYFANIEVLECRDCNELHAAPIQSLVKLRNIFIQTADKLLNIRFPESLTEISISARVLSQIEFPKGVTRISLGGCDALKQLEIPAGVKEINIHDLSVLSNVSCHAIVPPVTDRSLFMGSPIEQILVPLESVEEYKSAEGWSRYSEVIKGHNF